MVIKGRQEYLKSHSIYIYLQKKHIEKTHNQQDDIRLGFCRFELS